jgi:hypothetical protein
MAPLTATNLTVIATLLTLAATPAVAGDWSISAVSENELNISENRALRDLSQGISIAHISNLYLDFAYAMPDGNFDISADLSSSRYFGEASEDGVNDYLPHLRAEWLKSGKTDSLLLTADYRRQNVTLQDLVETPVPVLLPEFIPVDTVRTNTAAGLVWTHKVDARNTITLNSEYVATEFNNPVGVDKNEVTSTLEWERQLSRRSVGTITAGLVWSQQQNAGKVQQRIYSLDGQIKTRLTKRLTGTLGLGASLTDVDWGGRDPDMTFGNEFNVGLEYALKRTRINWNADYGLEEDTLGRYANRFSSDFAVTHTINDRSTIGATARLVLSEDASGNLGGDYAFFFTPSYTLDLTREWKMKAGYRYVHSNATTVASSNTVFVSMTRNFKILP